MSNLIKTILTNEQLRQYVGTHGYRKAGIRLGLPKSTIWGRLTSAGHLPAKLQTQKSKNPVIQPQPAISEQTQVTIPNTDFPIINEINTSEDTDIPTETNDTQNNVTDFNAYPQTGVTDFNTPEFLNTHKTPQDWTDKEIQLYVHQTSFRKAAAVIGLSKRTIYCKLKKLTESIAKIKKENETDADQTDALLHKLQHNAESTWRALGRIHRKEGQTISPKTAKNRHSKARFLLETQQIAIIPSNYTEEEVTLTLASIVLEYSIKSETQVTDHITKYHPTLDKRAIIKHISEDLEKITTALATTLMHDHQPAKRKTQPNTVEILMAKEHLILCLTDEKQNPSASTSTAANVAFETLLEQIAKCYRPITSTEQTNTILSAIRKADLKHNPEQIIQMFESSDLQHHRGNGYTNRQIEPTKSALASTEHIAAVLGIKPELVRKTENSALQKLRRSNLLRKNEHAFRELLAEIQAERQSKTTYSDQINICAGASYETPESLD